MVIKITKAKELKAVDWGVCAAIYGNPGVGKTTLVTESIYSEYGAPVDFIDVEGGARAISHLDEVTVISIIDTGLRGEGWQDVKGLVDDYVLGKRKAGTIVLDNASELLSLCIRWVTSHVDRGANVKPIDRPDIKDWSTVTSLMLQLIRKLRDFARNSGTNVFIIAWEAPEKDESIGGVTKRDLAFNPAFARQLPGIVDIVGRLTVKGKWRELSFEPSNMTAAKFRRGGGEHAMQVPGVIRYKEGDKPIVDILACLKGGKPWPKAKYAGLNAATAANPQPNGKGTSDTASESEITAEGVSN